MRRRCQPSTSLLVRTCWPYTDRLSADHTVLSSHVALTYDNSTVGQQQLHQEHQPRIWQRMPAGYVQPAAAGAPSACIAYVRPGLVTVRRRQTTVLSNRSSTAWLTSITIITVQLLTDARLLQVHVFTVNVVAPYTDIYTKKWRQISSASLPERHVRVPKQSYIDFGDNFNFGKLVCRRV